MIVNAAVSDNEIRGKVIPVVVIFQLLRSVRMISGCRKAVFMGFGLAVTIRSETRGGRCTVFILYGAKGCCNEIFMEKCERVRMLSVETVVVLR